MSVLDFIPALSTTSVLAAVLWLARKLIATRLTESVRHEYSQKLEELKSSIRKNEESFKAELKAKESQIEALRTGVLSNIASRQSVLHSQKIKAVEKLWAAVIALSPGKAISSKVSVINFETALNRAENDPKVRELFELLGSGFDPNKIDTSEASKSRPFLSPISWALFSAYQAIIFHSIAKMQMLQTGMGGPEIIDTKRITELVKVALPHRDEYINNHGPDSYHYFLDELEFLLLQEIDNILQDKESDMFSIQQAAEILKKAENLTSSGN